MTKILLIFSFLPTLALAVLFLFLFTGLFVGIGYVISLILPLSLFQASILCISTAFVVGFCLLGIAVYDYLFGISGRDFIEEDEYEEDEYEYEEDELEEQKRDPIFIRPTKLTSSEKESRNAPCPCGSGKNYKNCCGKHSAI